LLAAEFNPGLVPALAALASRLRDEDDFLAAAAAARRGALVRDGRLAAAVEAEPPALARRIVRGWLEDGVRPGVHAGHVERVLELARRSADRTVVLPAGMRVRREADWLVRDARQPSPPQPFCLAIAPGDEVVHPEGRWRVVLSPPEPMPPGGAAVPGPQQALFDADGLASVMLLRSRRAGDRVHLPGVGTRKLQDVLVDAKVPRADRDAVPLLEVNGAIIWGAGVVRAAGARIGPATRRIVRARLAADGAPV
jgi:tRNA(Ile)-lysidine synthase